MASSEAYAFQAFISEKNGFVVVSLVGLLEEQTLARFEECVADVQKLEYARLVINFRDVTGLTSDCIPAVARLQKSARDRQAELRLCGVRPELKEKLHRAGILRPHELSDNLQTALQSLVVAMRKSA